MGDFLKLLALLVFLLVLIPLAQALTQEEICDDPFLAEQEYGYDWTIVCEGGWYEEYTAIPEDGNYFLSTPQNLSPLSVITPTQSFSPWYVIIVLFSIILLFLVFILNRHRKQNVIRQYIHDARHAGAYDAQIRQLLRERGFSEKYINHIFSTLDSQQ